MLMSTDYSGMGTAEYVKGELKDHWEVLGHAKRWCSKRKGVPGMLTSWLFSGAHLLHPKSKRPW